MSGEKPPQDFNEIDILSFGSLRQGQKLIYEELKYLRESVIIIQTDMKWYNRIGAVIGGLIGGAVIGALILGAEYIWLAN